MIMMMAMIIMMLLMKKRKPIQSYAKIYAKGVVSAVATADHHDKDSQRLNQ